MVTRFHWFSVVLLLAIGVGVLGCGPRGHSGRIRDGGDHGVAADQLKGTWVLVEFEPEVNFEPMLADLLQAQMDLLMVTFNGHEMTAEGPGINATRSYEVVQSLFDRVDIVIFGDDGSTYEMVGRYIGDDLQFESRTPPWTGKGRLRRP